jgi:hypothetical protein
MANVDLAGQAKSWQADLFAFVIRQLDDLRNGKRNTEEWQQSCGDLRHVLQNIQPEGADDRGSSYREVLKYRHVAVASMMVRAHLTMAVEVIALFPDAEEAENPGSDVAGRKEEPHRVHIRSGDAHCGAVDNKNGATCIVRDVCSSP